MVKKVFKIFIIIIIHFIVIRPAFSEVKKQSMCVAMFENITKDREIDWVGAGFAETLTSKLVNVKSLRVIERSQLSKIVEEQKLQMSGLIDEKTAVKVGKLLAAQYMVVGSFQKLAEKLKVTARVVSVETSQAEKSVSAAGQFNDLFDIQEELALKLAAVIDAPVTKEEKVEIAKAPAENLTAYEWYAKAKMYQYERYQWDEAIRCYKEAIKIDKNYADAYTELGIILWNKGLYDEALDVYKNSFSLYEKNKDEQGFGRTYTNIGLIYYSRGDYDKALEYYNKDLEIKKRLGDERGLAQNYINTGIIYHGRGDYDKALEYYNKSLEINRRFGDEPGLASVYSNIGLTYYARKDYDKSLEYYNKSLDITRRLGNETGSGHTMYNIVFVYEAKGDHQKAVEFAEESVKIFEKTGYSLLNDAREKLRLLREKTTKTSPGRRRGN